MRGEIKLFSILIVTGFIISCTGRHAQKTEQIISEQRNTKLPDSLLRKWKAGIDFSASGNTPVNWNLEADFDKEINFSAGDGSLLRLIPVFTQTQENEQTVYRVTSGDSSLDIILSQSTCFQKDGMAGALAVLIKLGNRQYSGCGRFLFNNQLNDIWVLSSINGVPINRSEFKGKEPSLYFQLESGRVEGFDGCSSFNGKVTVQGNRINFLNLMGFSGPCKNPSIRTILFTHLNNKMVDYRLSQNNLLLYLEDDSKLEFIRKKF